MTFPTPSLGSVPRRDGAEDERALADLARRLRSLRDGDLAVVEAVSLGAPAIAVLREVLFERDVSGIFEPRRRAVQALAALGAYDVLREFVASWEAVADPVQRMGDEAALGAAARALGAARDEEAFQVLFDAVRRHAVAGVIEALGEYRRVEVIPILADALEDDLNRAAAQDGLRKLGQDALPAVVEIALRAVIGPSGCETCSGMRQRRSALALLLELGVNADAWDRLRGLVDDADDEVAALACRIGMAAADDAGKRVCAQRLIRLLSRAAWFSYAEIEDCLSANLTFANEAVDRALRDLPDDGGDDAARSRLKRSLQKIKVKVSATRAQELAPDTWGGAAGGQRPPT